MPAVIFNARFQRALRIIEIFGHEISTAFTWMVPDYFQRTINKKDIPVLKPERINAVDPSLLVNEALSVDNLLAGAITMKNGGSQITVHKY